MQSELITPSERKAIVKKLKEQALEGDAASACVLLTHGDSAAQRKAVRDFKRAAPHLAGIERR